MGSFVRNIPKQHECIMEADVKIDKGIQGQAFPCGSSEALTVLINVVLSGIQMCVCINGNV